MLATATAWKSYTGSMNDMTINVASFAGNLIDFDLNDKQLAFIRCWNNLIINNTVAWGYPGPATGTCFHIHATSGGVSQGTSLLTHWGL